MPVIYERSPLPMSTPPPFPFDDDFSETPQPKFPTRPNVPPATLRASDTGPAATAVSTFPPASAPSAGDEDATKQQPSADRNARVVEATSAGAVSRRPMSEPAKSSQGDSPAVSSVIMETSETPKSVQNVSFQRGPSEVEGHSSQNDGDKPAPPSLEELPDTTKEPSAALKASPQTGVAETKSTGAEFTPSGTKLEGQAILKTPPSELPPHLSRTPSPPSESGEDLIPTTLDTPLSPKPSIRVPAEHPEAMSLSEDVSPPTQARLSPNPWNSHDNSPKQLSLSPLKRLLLATHLDTLTQCRRIQDLLVLTTDQDTLTSFIFETLTFINMFPFRAQLGFFTLKQLFLCHPEVVILVCLQVSAIPRLFSRQHSDAYGADFLLLLLTYKTSYLCSEDSPSKERLGQQETLKLLDICQKRAGADDLRRIPSSELRDWVCRIWLDLPGSRPEKPSVMELCLYWICDEEASTALKQPAFHVLRCEVERLGSPGPGETWLIAAVLELIGGLKGFVSRDLQHVLIFIHRTRLPVILATLFRTSQWSPSRVLALWRYVCVYAWGPEPPPDFLSRLDHTYGSEPLPLYDFCAAFLAACMSFQPPQTIVSAQSTENNAHEVEKKAERPTSDSDVKQLRGSLTEGCFRMLAVKASNPLNAQHTLQLLTHLLISGSDPLAKRPNCALYVQSLVPFFERLKFVWTTTRSVSSGLITLLAHVTQLLCKICHPTVKKAAESSSNGTVKRRSPSSHKAHSRMTPPVVATAIQAPSPTTTGGSADLVDPSPQHDQGSPLKTTTTSTGDMNVKWDVGTSEGVRERLAFRTPFTTPVKGALPSKYLPYTQKTPAPLIRRQRSPPAAVSTSTQTAPISAPATSEPATHVSTAIASAVAAAVAAVGETLKEKLVNTASPHHATTVADPFLSNVYNGTPMPAVPAIGDAESPSNPPPPPQRSVQNGQYPTVHTATQPPLDLFQQSLIGQPIPSAPFANHFQPPSVFSTSGTLQAPLPLISDHAMRQRFQTLQLPEARPLPFYSSPAAPMFVPPQLPQLPFHYQEPAVTGLFATAPPLMAVPPNHRPSQAPVVGGTDVPQYQQPFDLVSGSNGYPPFSYLNAPPLSPTPSTALAKKAPPVTYLELAVPFRFVVEYYLGSPRCGLANLGNTCYLNAFLQSLFLCNAFVANLFRFWLPPDDDTVNPDMLREMQILFGQLIKTRRSSISPRRFLDTLPDFYRNGQQQDSTEVARYIFSALGGHSHRTEVISDFGFPIPTEREASRLPSPPSIQSLFDTYSASEELKGDNAYNCERCNAKVTAVRWTEIESPPAHLFIVLNRFSWNVHTGERVKEKTHVELNEHIVVWGLRYDMYAVVFHQGASANSGHYYAYGCRSESRRAVEKRHWYCLNDAHVSREKGVHIVNERSRDTRRDDRPYIVFYRCREAPPAPHVVLSPSMAKQVKKRDMEDVLSLQTIASKAVERMRDETHQQRSVGWVARETSEQEDCLWRREQHESVVSTVVRMGEGAKRRVFEHTELKTLCIHGLEQGGKSERVGKAARYR